MVCPCVIKNNLLWSFHLILASIYPLSYYGVFRTQSMTRCTIYPKFLIQNERLDLDNLTNHGVIMIRNTIYYCTLLHKERTAKEPI
jgi:hypothetical protein